MTARDQIREAVIDYCRRRGQMGPRKAAAHVMQTFGITSSQLSAALADEKLLLAQRSHADELEAV